MPVLSQKSKTRKGEKFLIEASIILDIADLPKDIEKKFRASTQDLEARKQNLQSKSVIRQWFAVTKLRQFKVDSENLKIAVATASTQWAQQRKILQKSDATSPVGSSVEFNSPEAKAEFDKNTADAKATGRNVATMGRWVPDDGPTPEPSSFYQQSNTTDSFQVNSDNLSQLDRKLRYSDWCSYPTLISKKMSRLEAVQKELKKLGVAMPAECKNMFNEGVTEIAMLIR